jgi:catechol 2,3-dioxygenase-like lactoylglutathione lyase family enzyme
MAELPPPPEGIVLTHFIVSDDVERSRRFYTEVLGGRVERPGDPVNCDAVLRLPGDSAGADLDVATAERLGLPVYHGLAEIPRLGTPTPVR